ncbi:MAG: maleylacetate reductase [Corynebacterium sp.]|uniref:maleylacetate reductase n=1 Tax=Corynebacterium sp. TaxID=1720 RepID=UPI0026E09050|nr:maleylacetate reductase [Corynebacterium sp.]MDO5670685.1 maleylacetate reductase [Corynebacterium sp.]
MSLNFTHDTLAQRVLFGAGRAAEHLREEVARLQAARIMVITTQRGREQAAQVAELIDVCLWHTDTAQHVPVEVAERARDVVKQHGIDLMVTVGGGSVIGLAKAVSLTENIPSIAVPTTYAGSEGTNIWGLTEGGRKKTGTDDRVLPVAVIYDSQLTFTLPIDLSVASGLNGLAHCVDALWAPRANPINAALATEGARALAEGLPLITRDPQGIDGRDLTLYGAYLSAVALTSAGSGLHHKLCHILGGTFGLPHAQTHAAVLPHVLAFNAPYAPAAEERLARAFGAASAVEGLAELYGLLDAPRSLAALGFTAEGIPDVVEQALEVVPFNNPRDVTRENLTHLLENALDGGNVSD